MTSVRAILLELTFNFMECPSSSMLNWRHKAAEKDGTGAMLQTFLMKRASSLISAVLGGYGVFCVIYSFSSPVMAGQALVLLGTALSLSYFGRSQ